MQRCLPGRLAPVEPQTLGVAFASLPLRLRGLALRFRQGNFCKASHFARKPTCRRKAGGSSAAQPKQGRSGTELSVAELRRSPAKPSASKQRAPSKQFGGAQSYLGGFPARRRLALAFFGWHWLVLPSPASAIFSIWLTESPSLGLLPKTPNVGCLAI